MNSTATLAWFARHELRIAWRDWLGMMTSGRRSRRIGVMVGLVVVAAVMHFLAYAVIGRAEDPFASPAPATLIVISASVVLGWALVLSQAIEQATKVFYARGDLDLIMSSPYPLTTVMSLRMGAVALTMIALAFVMVLPFVDVLALKGGVRWFATYGVTIAAALSATATALLATVALFRIFGPRRTRLAAQVASAIVGAGFVIALQVGAILSYGTMSRFAVLMSDHASDYAPAPNSILWWPARAILGDGVALVTLLALSLVLLGVAMAVCAPLFGDSVLSVAGGSVATRTLVAAKPFRARSPQQALRRKELMLLRRDPWLVSQTLMQLLYLVPPALMMWRSFGSGAGTALLLVPVIVMAAGQLAGGIAWLSISGEDAPDLIATTPLPRSAVMRAKIDVVLIAIASVLTPLLVPMAIASPRAALVAAVGAAIAAIAATTIQYWFRAQARRSQFRRRHTSSRIATFAEAFSSIGWAAVSALVLISPLVASVTAVMLLVVLALTYAISPRRA
jgi:ABC-2 type transport system permease protein